MLGTPGQSARDKLSNLIHRKGFLLILQEPAQILRALDLNGSEVSQRNRIILQPFKLYHKWSALTSDNKFNTCAHTYFSVSFLRLVSALRLECFICHSLVLHLRQHKLFRKASMNKWMKDAPCWVSGFPLDPGWMGAVSMPAFVRLTHGLDKCVTHIFSTIFSRSKVPHSESSWPFWVHTYAWNPCQYLNTL